MNSFNLYQKRCFINKKLPATFMFLDNWCIINVEGTESAKYLNQQFTLDITTVTNNMYQVGAHCNYNGKLWSPLLIFKYKDGYAYIVQSEIVLKQMEELKKYSIFSKVNIFLNKNMILFGFAGFGAREILKKYFDKLPDSDLNIIYYKDVIILRFSYPTERFLVICLTKESCIFVKLMSNNMFISSDLQWKTLDIESNFPLMNIVTFGQFLPQSLNLKNWNAICFNKGCYYGQEVLFRYEQRKIDKFNIQVLIGKSKNLPIIGSFLQYYDDMKSIYNAGIILAAIKLLNNKILLQVRMKKIFCKKNFIFCYSKDKNSRFLFFNKNFA